MVTIYTERGPAAEIYAEQQTTKFNFGLLAAITIGTALLLSLIATYNLSSDIKDLTDNKLVSVQQQLSGIQQRMLLNQNMSWFQNTP